MYTLKIILKLKQRIDTKTDQICRIISPLGEKLPTFVSSETYFADLQKQWKWMSLLVLIYVYFQ